MKAADFLRLILLAAIWGASFLFMRIGAPVLGPAVLIEYRVGFAALFLAAVGFALKKPLGLRRHWKHFLIIGFFNSTLPFLLYAFAAKSLSASVLSVLNATSPIWGALIAAIWTRKAMAPRTLLGLLLGLGGVALLVGFDTVSAQDGAGLAIGAGLLAAFCYGIATNYAKSAQAVEPFANAHGSMWAATLMVLPALPFFPAPASPSAGVMAAVLALGVLCSGVAFLLYFRLIHDVGATSALTVTFLIPVFGILWGCLFLGEVIGWYTIAGSAIVIVGTALVTGLRPSLSWLRKSASA
ncbi:DMT family transporter [Janthinobacterium fluminis]|uniref:DMT family transporter n=1 Tax=Janthinobacterium fluminis TaxID=2987524 RepID=A0ABT5K324_9BURK|nr:DMT family transporter [Janthinobacterium fluminis]MDC8759376.1 DMT family transporter [Janthinobacterium fluminis]